MPLSSREEGGSSEPKPSDPPQKDEAGDESKETSGEAAESQVLLTCSGCSGSSQRATVVIICLLDGSRAVIDVSIVMIPNVIIGYHSCSNALL
jgi:hypothetical protein